MKIITINKNNRYFKEFVNINYNWWGYKKDFTLETMTKHYLDSFEKKLPKLRALISNDTLIGFYELNEKDYVDEADYTPYLANVYIKEEYRKRGYSTLLINDSISYAKELGYKDLYLHSKHENYYEKYNFEFIGEVETKYGNKRIFKHKK